jgi:hypothetical protein
VSLQLASQTEAPNGNQVCFNILDNGCSTSNSCCRFLSQKIGKLDFSMGGLPAWGAVPNALGAVQAGCTCRCGLAPQRTQPREAKTQGGRPKTLRARCMGAKPPHPQPPQTRLAPAPCWTF